MTTEIDGEEFDLPNQSAHDVSRYDVVKDVVRIEQLVSMGLADEGWAITLTNDSSYWRPGTKAEPIDAQFRVHEGVVLSGSRRWALHAGEGTTRNRSATLDLGGTHRCHWRSYDSDHAELPLRWLAFRAVTPL